MKNQATVPVIGYEGEPGEITGYYVYPIFSKDKIDYTVLTGHGKTLQEARMEANLQSNQTLNITQVQVVLFTDETAKHDLYDYLDPFYRFPRNRLTAYPAIVEGSMADYVDVDKQLADSLPKYYREIIESSSFSSDIQEVNLQKACTLMFDKGVDLTLPYFTLDKENGSPKISGNALFSNNKYTGSYLTREESVIFNIMNKTQGRFSRLASILEFKGKEYNLSYDIVKAKRKWKISEVNGKVNLKATYELDITLNEIPIPTYLKVEDLKELEAFLNKALEKRFTETFDKMQKAKSDALGIGRKVRAHHPDIWKKANWHDQYSEMEAEINVKTTIFSTGILR